MEPVVRRLEPRDQAPPTEVVPRPSPLAMPVQSLRRLDHLREGLPATTFAVRRARFLLFGGTLLLTAALGREMWQVLAVGQLTLVEMVMLALFIVNIAWISFGSISALLGFLTPATEPREDPEPLRSRTALLVPAYNEDPAKVMGTAVAMLRALDEAGSGDAFELFVLSDTNKSEVWLAEQALVEAARAEPVIGTRLHYRHRLRNRARKAGNIGDWVRRWGGAYDFMLVLDADSLMDAQTVIELAQRMQSDPDTGIIQTVPQLINGRTLLARLQQFASRAYGPVLARGLRSWHGRAGNYWGHNAIIRTEAFAACAGLPELSGAPPFGGLILSHDFVEAGLVRRGGYAVRMAGDLGGSYEHAPPNLIELAIRDRRWCQGNLQHARLLTTAGLHPLSRLHLAMGVMSYLASPLWLLFLLAGMTLALYAEFVPPSYFAEQLSLFPEWPRIDAERAISLFIAVMLVLFTPKLLGIVAFLREPAATGHRLGAIASFLVETLLSALIAPLSMMAQTRSVIEILTGRDSGWNVQARDAEGVAWHTAWRFHGRQSLEGLLLALAAGAISFSLLAWMSPALIGLCLAVPLSMLVGNRSTGSALARLGLLDTPEDRLPPPIALAAAAESTRLAQLAPAPYSLQELIADSHALRRHLAWLDTETARPLGELDTALASAMLKIADDLSLDQLDAKEAYAVLASRRLLTELADRAEARR